jgi:hypothetical protein
LIATKGAIVLHRCSEETDQCVTVVYLPEFIGKHDSVPVSIYCHSCPRAFLYDPLSHGFGFDRTPASVDIAAIGSGSAAHHMGTRIAQGEGENLKRCTSRGIRDDSAPPKCVGTWQGPSQRRKVESKCLSMKVSNIKGVIGLALTCRCCLRLKELLAPALQIVRNLATITRKQLEAIVLPGIVTGSDHDSAGQVTALGKPPREPGRRQHAEVHNRHPCPPQATRTGITKGGS